MVNGPIVAYIYALAVVGLWNAIVGGIIGLMNRSIVICRVRCPIITVIGYIAPIQDSEQRQQ